jgi:hypothetical protein
MRIINGQTLDKPLLKVSVSNSSERGLLGIAAEEISNEKIVCLSTCILRRL